MARLPRIGWAEVVDRKSSHKPPSPQPQLPIHQQAANRTGVTTQQATPEAQSPGKGFLFPLLVEDEIVYHFNIIHS